MRVKRGVLPLGLAMLACWGAVVRPAEAQEKKVVKTEADLPRFSYPLREAPSALLSADDATFLGFARKVGADVDSVLTGYTIEDRATLRGLLGCKANIDVLRGDWDGARSVTGQIRGLEDKPQAKLTDGLYVEAVAEAQHATHALSGPEFQSAFKAEYAKELNASPWASVGEWARDRRMSDDTLSMTVLRGAAQADLDPVFAKTGALDAPSARILISYRVAAGVIQNVGAEKEVLTAYIAAHSAQKPDIWASREVPLTPDQKLSPVRVAIFDSGVDTSLFPGQLYLDPNPGGHSPHGLAFDTQGGLYNGDLQPLTPEQKAAYPQVLTLMQGFEDMHNGVESKSAAEVKKLASSVPPDQLSELFKQMDFLGQYLHGTHVAGIAVRGNPAAQLVLIQFDDALPDLPFAPTVAWAERFKADFQQVGEYLRDHDVRVVNMSWADSQSEIEDWLSKTSGDKDPDARKRLAAQVYAIWREAVSLAIQGAPNTLFVCAAGNSNSNPNFLGDVPASLQLPNLVTVGAVDQAGDETSFTSFGETVVLDANGYQVESVVPGGTKLRLSGTSMASPNVANLAAKMFALNPKLTPEQVLSLMKQGAHASPDGRLHLIDPKATIALLSQEQAAR